MEINDYARKGVAGAGLGLGIAGTALGLMNGGLGNIFGGWGGWNGNGWNGNCMNGTNGWGVYGLCHENTPVNRYELGQESKIAELQSQIALRDANTYNDQKMLELYKYFDGKLGEVHSVLGSQAVQNQATKDSFQLLQERLECCKNEMCGALARERDERRCGDNAIVNYVNATFYPKMVADVTTGTTTTAQTVYNPLPIATCGCGC